MLIADHAVACPSVCMSVRVRLSRSNQLNTAGRR